MLPLSGITVIELGRVYAAPWTGLMLADMGADVIKVEDPHGGDMMRATGPGFARDGNGNVTGDSGKFQALNRNKRSITVDIASSEGQEIVRELTRNADVFIENYKVGDLKRRGLDYSSLRTINERLIYTSITGFGQTGPYAHRPAFDAVGQAYSGFMSVNGEAGGPPLRSTVNVMDFSTAMFAAFGITAALIHRGKGGSGQHLDISMIDSALSMMSYPILSALLAGVQPPRTGSANVDWVPSGNYASSDGLLYIVSGPNRDFKNFCNAIGRPDLLLDPRFATRQSRNEHVDAFNSLTREILARYPTSYWTERLTQFGVVHAPVFEFADIRADPHIKARNSVVEIPHAAGGCVPLVRNPIRFSDMEAYREHAAPLLGEHTDEVLRQYLGYDDSRIAALRRSRIL